MAEAEKAVQMALLFDFFGELLTEKQRACFDLYYNEDLSLSEIGSDMGITRQGVRDFIRRGADTLLEMEKKTGLVQRYGALTREIAELQADLAKLARLCENDDAATLIREIGEKLGKLTI